MWSPSVTLCAALLVWAFRVWAQFDADPPDDGWVVTATRAACEAGRRSYVETAQTYGSVIELGDCREVTLEELERLKPLDQRAWPSAH